MSILRKRPFSVLNPGYFDIFEEFDDFFNDQYDIFTENLNFDKGLYISKEKRLKKQLKKTQQLENEIQKKIDEFQQQLDDLEDSKKQINQQNDKLMKQIEKANQYSEQNEKNDHSKTKVFKRIFYQTPQIEIEEQYDSTDPKQCYKIIKRQGELPQIIQGTKEDNKDSIESEQLSEIQKDKLKKLCKITDQKQNDVIKLIKENPEMTIGQLYDKLMINQNDNEKTNESQNNNLSN